MGQAKQYDREYKEEALKRVEEKGCKNASEELGISYNTLYGWVKEARKGNLHLEKRSDSNVSKLEEGLPPAVKRKQYYELLVSAA